MQLRVCAIIVAVYVSMISHSAHATCAAGEMLNIFSTRTCVEPVLIGSGDYADFECSEYTNDWAGLCADDGNCDICVCSCVGPDHGCPTRPSIPTEVCTVCP